MTQPTSNQPPRVSRPLPPGGYGNSRGSSVPAQDVTAVAVRVEMARDQAPFAPITSIGAQVRLEEDSVDQAGANVRLGKAPQEGDRAAEVVDDPDRRPEVEIRPAPKTTPQYELELRETTTHEELRPRPQPPVHVSMVSSAGVKINPPEDLLKRYQEELNDAFGGLKGTWIEKKREGDPDFNSKNCYFDCATKVVHYTDAEGSWHQEDLDPLIEGDKEIKEKYEGLKQALKKVWGAEKTKDFFLTDARSSAEGPLPFLRTTEAEKKLAGQESDKEDLRSACKFTLTSYEEFLTSKEGGELSGNTLGGEKQAAFERITVAELLIREMQKKAEESIKDKESELQTKEQELEAKKKADDGEGLQALEKEITEAKASLKKLESAKQEVAQVDRRALYTASAFARKMELAAGSDAEKAKGVLHLAHAARNALVKQTEKAQESMLAQHRKGREGAEWISNKLSKLDEVEGGWRWRKPLAKFGKWAHPDSQLQGQHDTRNPYATDVGALVLNALPPHLERQEHASFMGEQGLPSKVEGMSGALITLLFAKNGDSASPVIVSRLRETLTQLYKKDEMGEIEKVLFNAGQEAKKHEPVDIKAAQDALIKAAGL